MDAPSVDRLPGGAGPIRTPDQRLRVFVSSTMFELAAERQAAVKAIDNLHITPVLFEVGARPHPPRDLYTAYLRQSDVFIGIYAAKYGWVDSSMNVSGIEDEYDLSANMPRLIYVKECDEREPRLTELVERITVEGSASYKRFSDATELGRLVENDLALLLSERFNAGGLSAEGGSSDLDGFPEEVQPPEIQYASTPDGVSIAHYAVGEGPALLFTMLPFSNLQTEWRVPFLRNTYASVARGRTLVRLDHRGFGLSSREVYDYSVDNLVLDIEAVVQRLGLKQLDICAVGFASIPGLAFTARHPDLVTHFVQGTPAVSGTDFLNERLRKLYELAEVDWDFAKETIVRSFNPDADEQVRRDIVRLITASIDRAEWRRFLDQVEPWDVEADAMGMSTPTLLVHRENPNANLDVLRRVAGLIRNSRVTFSNADDDLQAALVAASMHDAASA